MVDSVAETTFWGDFLTARVPQKYVENIEKYRARGGILDLEADIKRFAYNDQVRFFTFCLIADQVVKDKVHGDFAELGVFKGNSAQFLASVARRLDRTTYLLDTFEGFDNRDLSENELPLSGSFSDTSLEAVRAKVGGDKTVFVKGYFPETSSQIPRDAKFALVHIDCDLGEPMMAGLQYFYPRMQPGGFIVMHDYNSLYWDGAEKAIDDFFTDKPESVIPMPDLCGSVVIRKCKC